MTKYSVGHPTSPQPNDPRFDSEQEAVRHACDKTGGAGAFNTLLAVWHDDDGELRVLVFEGTAYYP